MSEKLPVKTEDTVMEVSLKHLITGFSTLFAAAITVGTTVTMLKDYSKFRRQKALLESAKEVLGILFITEKGGKTWNNNKKLESTSPIQKSKE